MHIRYATIGDVEWCIDQDFSIKQRQMMENKIANREIVLAELGGKRVGYLRMEYMWGKIPYMSVIDIVDGYRKQGVGKALLQFLERKVKDEDCEFLITSAESSEPEAKTWHEHMGFVECGCISGLNPDGSSEIFLKKNL